MEFTAVARPNMKVSRVAFMNRLGAKLRDVYTLASQSVDVQIFKDKLMAATYVDLDDVDTVAGLNSLVPVIYTQAEVDAILTQIPLEKELP